jgi:hypothetical protein
MVINYFGGNCFRLQSGEGSILFDPINNRLKADIVLRTIAPSNLALPLEPNEIAFAGEYEISGIEIYGFEVEKESTNKFIKTIFEIFWDDLKIVNLGPLAQIPEGDFLDDISNPDVLFLPVGKKPVLKPEEAVKIVKKLEPKIIIPSFVHENTKEFLKILGQKGDPEEKFVFKKKDIENKVKEVVLLKAI